MILYACFFNLRTLLLTGFLKPSIKVQISDNFGLLSPEFSASCHLQGRVSVGGFLHLTFPFKISANRSSPSIS